METRAQLGVQRFVAWLSLMDPRSCKTTEEFARQVVGCSAMAAI